MNKQEFEDFKNDLSDALINAFDEDFYNVMEVLEKWEVIIVIKNNKKDQKDG